MGRWHRPLSKITGNASALEPAALILVRQVGAIDHNHLQQAFGCLEFQAQLIFQRGEDRWTGVIGLKGGREVEFDFDVVWAGKAGAILL